jgi:hypothetical protein
LEAQKESVITEELKKNQKRADEILEKKIREEKAATLKLTREAAAAEREADAQQKEQKEDLEKRLKDILDLKKRIAASDAIGADRSLFFQYKTNPEGMAQLDREAKSIEKILQQLEDAEAKTRGERVKGMLDNVKKLNVDLAGKTTETINSALKGVSGKIDINVKNPLEKDITDALARTNWPSELRALGEFVLKFIIAKARDERIPLVVSTL